MIPTYPALQIGAICAGCGSVHRLDHPHFQPDRYSLPPGYADSLGALAYVGGLPISSRYGPRIHPTTGRESNHTGIDIPMPVGTPLVAVVSGIITRIDTDGVGKGVINGNAVFLKGARYLWMYLHMDRIIVTEGQYVRQGQIIGYSGNTGRSTGPHLHFQVKRNGGSLVDPVTLFPTGTFNA